MRFFLLSLILLSFSFAMAQEVKPADKAEPKPAPKVVEPGKLILNFPTEGERKWMIIDEKEQAIVPPVSIKDKSTAITLPADIKTGALVVEDTVSGNVAVIPLDNLIGKTDLTISEFPYVSKVNVKVEKDNKPVYDVVVKLKDSSDKPAKSVLIDKTTPGIAVFQYVLIGKLNIEIVRSDGGKDIHEEILNASRPEPTQNYTYPTMAQVSVVEPPAPPAPAEVKPEPKRITVGAIITWMIVLVVGLFILIVLLNIIRGKSDKVSDAMKKMGVQLPDAIQPGNGNAGQTATQAQPVVPEGFCQYCGQKKDPNGNCGCALGAVKPVGSSPTGIPRLVALTGQYAGQTFNLDATITSIGREVGNTIALEEDKTISRRHAQIAKSGDTYTVTDFNSSNGTFVNDAKLTGEAIIKPGDTVQFGSSKFTFEA